MENATPTDEEYLDILHDILADTEYLDDRSAYFEEHQLDEQFNRAVEEMKVPPEQIEAFREFFISTMHPKNMYKNGFISLIREQTLALTGSEKSVLQHIPVGLLPTLDLNACAIATPRKGAVILLNQSLISNLTLVCRCAIAYATWKTETPYCHTNSQKDYGAALVGLAKMVTSGNVDSIVDHKNVLDSLRDNEMTNNIFELMFCFILLHEYGHVAHDHLTTSRLCSAFEGKYSDIKEYTKSEIQEFEADNYATNKIVRAMETNKKRIEHAALAIYMLMQFFRLCETMTARRIPEHMRTHPRPEDRWNKMKAIIYGKYSHIPRTDKFDLLFGRLVSECES